jgi:hypothetical protein
MKNRFRDYRDRLAKRLADKRLTGNSFCPTGKGGGVDPSCSPGGGPPVKFDRSRHTEELGEATNEFFDDHPHATAKALDDRKVDSTPNRRLPDVSRPPVHELDVAKSLHNYTWGYDGPMNQALRKEGNPPSGEIGATEPVPKAKRKKTTTNASDESSQPRNRMVGDEDEAHYWVQAFTS